MSSNAQPFLPPSPPPDPEAPGPFAFANAERTSGILSAAGWSEVDVAPLVRQLQIGGTTDFDEVIDLSYRIGPAGRALATVAVERQHEARAAIREALLPYRSDQGLLLDGVCWLATATRA